MVFIMGIPVLVRRNRYIEMVWDVLAPEGTLLSDVR